MTMCTFVELQEYSNNSNNLTGLMNESENNEVILFQYIAWGVAGTGIALLGLIGNILSIVVLAHRRMKSATSCYLIALSVYDCLVLLSLVLSMSLPIIYIKTYQMFWYFKIYPYLQPFAYPLALTAQTCSIYTTVGFTIERYIAVCCPLRAASWCTLARARKGILIILLASVCYNFPRMLEYRTITCIDPQTNVSDIRNIHTSFGSNPFYRHIYLMYLHLVIMVIIPFTVLAVLNTMLIRAVRKSQKAQGKITNKQNKENNLTIMLISVIVVFLICQVLSIADNILAVTLDEQTIQKAPFVKLTTISSLCVIMNSATNFYLYCLFGRKFRRVFCHVLCSCLNRNNNNLDKETIILRSSVKHHDSHLSYKDKKSTHIPVNQQKQNAKCTKNMPHLSSNQSKDVNSPLINNIQSYNESEDQQVSDDPNNEGHIRSINGKACMVTHQERDKMYYTVIKPSDRCNSDVNI